LVGVAAICACRCVNATDHRAEPPTPLAIALWSRKAPNRRRIFYPLWDCDSSDSSAFETPGRLTHRATLPSSRIKSVFDGMTRPFAICAFQELQNQSPANGLPAFRVCKLEASAGLMQRNIDSAYHPMVKKKKDEIKQKRSRCKKSLFSQSESSYY